MKIVGFSFIRNAVKYDYPFVEAVRSILPICEEVVLVVGQSEDETLALAESIDPERVRIIQTVWNDNLRKSGFVLSQQTNIAFDAIAQADWCFYIQGDEVLHDDYYDSLRASMERHLDNPEVEGLLFEYKHFYGSYDFVGDSRKWYRKEVRAIRNDKTIRSYRDAQGFRKHDRKLFVKPANALIHHYGWVKHPEKQQMKQKNFNKLWHTDEWMKENIPDVDTFDYSKIDSLIRFEGKHPQVMQERIRQVNWQFSFDPTQRSLSWKERWSRAIEYVTGIRVGEHKNYKLL